MRDNFKSRLAKMPRIKKLTGKRAVSSLVATVILILIVINATMIIALIVIPTIEDSIKISNACTNARLSIETSGYTCFNESCKKANVVVARGPDEHELSGMLLGLEGGNGTSASYIVKQQDPAIVLSLNFNEGSGTRAADSSGSNNDGSVAGTWVQGKYGQGVDFDKPNESVTVSKSQSLEITDNITIEAWIKIDSVKEEPVPDFIIGRS